MFQWKHISQTTTVTTQDRLSPTKKWSSLGADRCRTPNRYRRIISRNHTDVGSIIKRSAAVDFQSLAGDETGFVAGKEEADVADFGRNSHPTDRLQGGDLL